MRSTRWIGAPRAAFLALPCIALAGPAVEPPAPSEPAVLAVELGCNSCHAADPAGSGERH